MNYKYITLTDGTIAQCVVPVNEDGDPSFGNKNIRTITGTETLTDADEVILVNAGVNMEVNLPTTVGRQGKIFTIKRIDATINTVDIDANGIETIDGSLTKPLSPQYDVLTIISDNANWHII